LFSAAAMQIRSTEFGRAMTLASDAFSQKEVHQHKIPFTPRKSFVADFTRDLSICGLRSNFDPDHLIKSPAARASEWIEFAPTHIVRPDNNSRILFATPTRPRAIASVVAV
jgi:hypothetical protein